MGTSNYICLAKQICGDDKKDMLCESEIPTVIRNLTKIELTLKDNCSRLDIYVLTFM